MTRTNIYLGEKQVKALNAIAAKSDVSVAEIVRRAVDAFLNASRKPANLCRKCNGLGTVRNDSTGQYDPCMACAGR